MGFLTKWLVNIFVIALVGILLYAFVPYVWNLIWALASGFYRPLFIIGLVLLAGLPALRSD